MHFIDDDKAPRLTLGLNEDDESGITLFSEGYINRWEAFCEDDAVIMKMSDLNESARLYSVILNDGSAYSSVNDEQEDFDILMGSVEGRVIFDVYEDEEAMNKTEETIEHIVEK